MKLTRKLIAAMLSVCMVLSLLTNAFAAEIQATYSTASYYDIAVQTYSRMLAFQNGGVVAAADQSRKYGLIDATGKVVVPFQYAYVWTLDGGLFGVAEGLDEYGRFTRRGVINASGETVLAPSEDCTGISCKNGIICVNINYNPQYYTTDWQPSTEDAYRGSGSSGDQGNKTPAGLEQYNWYTEIGGYYRVTKYDDDSKAWLVGIVDSSYKEVIAPGDYEYVGTPNADGYVSVTKSDGTTDLYKDGQVVKTFTDKKVATEVYFRYLTFSTAGSNQYGMMDIDGNVLMEERYKVIDTDGNGYIRTALDKEDNWDYVYGLYTQECRQVLADEYSEISYLADGKYRLHKDQYFGVSQISDAAVTPVIPMKYLDMRVHTHQFIELYDGSKYSVVDLSNNVVVPDSTEKINAFKGDTRGLYYTIDDAMWLSEEWDGYTESVLPFLALTDNGWVTVYADYKTGEVAGQVNVRASNINEDGWFVYQNNDGLYGFARVGDSSPGAPAVNAVLSPQKLAVDGKEVGCEKYNIDGSNYFKLRDLAYALNGTGSQFGVGFDAAASTVTITTGEAYQPAGGELDTGADNSSTAQPSSQTILINGVEHGELAVYNIGGSNFFKLRDLGAALGFEVDYDSATNTAIVRSA